MTVDKHKEALDAAYDALIKELKQVPIAAERVEAITTTIYTLFSLIKSNAKPYEDPRWLPMYETVNKQNPISQITEKLKKLIENGEMTNNQARDILGFYPIDDPTADALLKKV